MKKILLVSVLALMLATSVQVFADMVLESHSQNTSHGPILREDPPANLTATVVNYNDVHLEWMEPGAASILWDQIDTEGETYGKSAQDFEAAYNAYDAQVAGDFVLDGMAEITGAAFVFFYNQAYTQACPFNVWIFPDEAGVPGETPLHTFTTNSVTPDEDNIFEVEFTTPALLTAGTYWIGFNMIIDYGTAGVQCYANQKVTVINETPGYWRNPGNGFGTGFTTWTADINSQGGLPEDVTFQVHGNYIGNNHRTLLGYNVYRNGDMVNTGLVTETEYQDLGLDGGSYTYHVIAVYDTGDSPASNSQTVEIILYPPQNFNANLAGANVVCQWQVPGRGLNGYRVYRNGEMVGTTTSTFYVDQSVPAGVLEYYATAIYGEYESAPSNTIIINNTSADDGTIPVITEFKGNYPNPFNPATTLSYAVSESGLVALEIYNIRGEKIRTLLNQEMQPGLYTLRWDGSNDKGETMPSGIYFAKFSAGDYNSSRKMIMMK